MPSYYVHSLGCRASAADGEAIAAALERNGGLVAGPMEQAGVVVVNTCSVTAEAEKTARALIRRVRRTNPEARVVVTGCYAQRAPEELAALPGVDAIAGNSHKGSVVRLALGPASAPGFVPLTTLHTPYPAQWVGGEHYEALAPATGFRTRPILKVQDGCGHRCSFCVIPETRGPSRSVALDDALATARAFALNGGQELVLSGINLGRWGRDLEPSQTLADLVEALMEQTSLPRLRVSSVEPMDWPPELIELFTRYSAGKHPRLAAHAHLPLQSGSDEILRRMHRRYRPWHYLDRVHALRAALPDAALGADVMVGFPGETDALFQQTYDLIEASPLTYLHLFPFSPRPRTAAESLHQNSPVPAEKVRLRMEALRWLADEKHRRFTERFLGRTLSAVTLRDGTALTANFLRVTLSAPAPANRLVTLCISKEVESSLHGTVLVEAEPQGPTTLFVRDAMMESEALHPWR